MTPIVVNDNVIDLVITPGAKAGEPANVRAIPETQFVAIDGKVETTGEGPTTVDVHPVGPRRISVRGSLPAGHRPVVRIFDGGAYLYDPAGPDQNWDGGVVAASTSTDIGSGYQLLAGDYDADGQPDAFWYKPGSGTERLLYGIPSQP